MPPAKHAVLSASSSHRWLNCSPSARLEQEFEDRETEAAAEGTAAHALCEHKLRRALKLQSRRKPISRYDSYEMLTKCAELWVFGDRITKGMSQEIRKAESRNMIIRYFTTDFEEVDHA